MTLHPETEIVNLTSSQTESSQRVTTTAYTDPEASPKVTSGNSLNTTAIPITSDALVTSERPEVTTMTINSVTVTLTMPILTTQPVFRSVNRCLRSYIDQHDTLFEMEVLGLWDGTFNGLLEKSSSTLPDFILAPEMDVLLTKMHFLWKYEIQSCDLSSRDLCENYPRINEEILNEWSASECQAAPIINDFPQMQITIYHFREESELSFEFLQLRQCLQFKPVTRRENLESAT